MRRKHAELESNFENTYKFEITKKYQAYEQNISELQRRNAELEGKIATATQEIERLNNILRLKVEESTQLSANYRNLQNEHDELKRRAQANENALSQNQGSLQRENEELRRKLAELEANYNNLRQTSDRRLA